MIDGDVIMESQDLRWRRGDMESQDLRWRRGEIQIVRNLTKIQNQKGGRPEKKITEMCSRNY